MVIWRFVCPVREFHCHFTGVLHTCDNLPERLLKLPPSLPECSSLVSYGSIASSGTFFFVGRTAEASDNLPATPSKVPPSLPECRSLVAYGSTDVWPTVLFSPSGSILATICLQPLPDFSLHCSNAVHWFIFNTERVGKILSKIPGDHEEPLYLYLPKYFWHFFWSD